MSELVWSERVAAPLDRARRSVLSTAARTRYVRALLASRDLRIASIMSAHACLAFVLTILIPIPLLVLGPLFLGVPHVVGDLRHLVFRRPRERALWAALFVGCLALVAAEAAWLCGVRLDVASAEVGLGTLSIVVAVLCALRRFPERRVLALVTATVVLVIGGVAFSRPRTALAVLLHLHNLVALFAWLWLFRRRLRAVILPLTLVAILAALLTATPLIRAALHFGVTEAFGTNLLVAADWLAPGIRGPFGIGLASSFVFLQSVHYLVWLVAIPMDDRAHAGASSFRRGFRSLSQDLGRRGLALAALAWAIVIACGAFAPLVTRNTYLALAGFHVWLELAVLGFYAVAGRRTAWNESPRVAYRA